jgi:hypothetical protein
LPHDDADPVEKDLETYRMLLQLWMQENPIKTNKLQVLLAVNALLVSAASVGTGFTAGKWPVYLAGATFSLIWVLSIGRTSYYQALWDAKLDGLREAHRGDPRFAVLDVTPQKRAAKTSPRFGTRLLCLLGGVPSRWYLVFSPLVLALAWTVVLVLTQIPPSLVAR